MRSTIIENIRTQFHNHVDFLYELERINSIMFDGSKEVVSKSYKLLVDSFVERLKGLFYLLNLNYADEDKLITINYQNCDGVNILLRGAIESVIIMRILLENNTDEIYESFYNQIELDRKDIVSKFNESSKYFSKFDTEDFRAYNRYEWIKPILDKKVVTLDDLIKITNYDEERKAYYISEVLHNNNLSHPILKNDSVILDGMFGSGNVNEIIYFFEIITNLLYDLIRNLVEFDQKKLKGFYLHSIAQIKCMPEINDLNEFLRSNDVKKCNLYDQTKVLLMIREKYYDTKVSHADNLQSWILFYLMSLKPIQESNPRLFKTMDKYMESLMLNMQELVISFENKKGQIFFTKLRYVLELIATIDILITFDEYEMEVYQAHTDVLRYSAWSKIPEIMKNRLRDAGLMKEDPNKVMINYNGGKMSVFHIYLKNLDFLKKHYKEKYGFDITKGQVKHVNGWAINIVNSNNKAPSNLSIILSLLENNSEKFSKDLESLKDYFSGLYTLICSYCHATSFASFELNNGTDVFYIEEAYYYLIKVFDILMKNLETRFSSIIEMKAHMAKSKKMNESNSYEYSIGQILKKYEKKVII